MGIAPHIIIDGNNLLHAMHACAPIPNVGRETLLRIIERWAQDSVEDVTLIFDGATPRGGMSRQLASRCVDVRFSAPLTADDVIVRMVGERTPGREVRVVSSDTAVRHEAKRCGCQCVDSPAFVGELFAEPVPPDTRPPTENEKPSDVTPAQRTEWLEAFGLDDEDDPLDDFDAMMQ